MFCGAPGASKGRRRDIITMPSMAGQPADPPHATHLIPRISNPHFVT